MARVAVWFHPCNRTRHVLDRDLSPEEVQLAHADGLSFVKAKSKLFGWFRGRYVAGTKVFFVEDKHLFRWGVVESTTETGGALAKRLWNNEKLQQVMLLRETHDICPKTAYEVVQANVEGLPVTLKQSTRIEVPAAMLADLEAGRLTQAPHSPPQKTPIPQHTNADMHSTKKRTRPEDVTIFQPGTAGFLCHTRLQEGARTARKAWADAKTGSEAVKLEMANTQEHIAYLRQKLQDLQSKDSETSARNTKCEHAYKKRQEKLKEFEAGLEDFLKQQEHVVKASAGGVEQKSPK